METISLKLLQDSEPGSIIASGTFKDEGMCNICGTGNEVKWVAVRGRIPDWTIYHENIFYSLLVDWTDDQICSMGDKLPKDMASELVDMTEGVLNMYRE